MLHARRHSYFATPEWTVVYRGPQAGAHDIVRLTFEGGAIRASAGGAGGWQGELHDVDSCVDAIADAIARQLATTQTIDGVRLYEGASSDGTRYLQGRIDGEFVRIEEYTAREGALEALGSDERVHVRSRTRSFSAASFEDAVRKIRTKQ